MQRIVVDRSHNVPTELAATEHLVEEDEEEEEEEEEEERGGNVTCRKQQLFKSRFVPYTRYTLRTQG